MFYAGINSVRLTQSTPSAISLFSVTARGEVAVFDPVAAEKSGNVQRTQVLDVINSAQRFTG
jgi:hypothetical protein